MLVTFGVSMAYTMNDSPGQITQTQSKDMGKNPNLELSKQTKFSPEGLLMACWTFLSMAYPEFKDENKWTRAPWYTYYHI